MIETQGQPPLERTGEAPKRNLGELQGARNMSKNAKGATQ